MEVWMQMITSVGFPIAACAALWYYMVTLIKEHRKRSTRCARRWKLTQSRSLN